MLALPLFWRHARSFLWGALGGMIGMFTFGAGNVSILLGNGEILMVFSAVYLIAALCIRPRTR